MKTIDLYGFVVTFNLFQLVVWIILYDHNNQQLHQVNKQYNLIFKSPLFSYYSVRYAYFYIYLVSLLVQQRYHSEKIYLCTTLLRCMIISTNFFDWSISIPKILFRDKCITHDNSYG